MGEAATGDEAVRQARAHRPDVTLMDIRMPGLDGLAATGRILPEVPGRRVIVVTTFDTDEHVFEALRLGASGFLTKDVRADELRGAVRSVGGRGAAVAGRHPPGDRAVRPQAPARA
ncbi:response regulator [[Actinomadura] parvosata]|uniref:response regulator n=1 Tax=[Actinomadura] parvosata TaxID=1955412 RepID=UPI00406D044C